MRRTPHRFCWFRLSSPVVGTVLVWMTLFALGVPDQGHAADSGAKAQIGFGVRMAQQGLWQEALFRFHQAEKLDPKNPRVLNNLAVAYEATGDFDRALDFYKQSLAVAPDNRETRRNYARFVEFFQAYKGKPKEPKEPKEKKPGEGAEPKPTEPPPAPAPPLPAE